MCELTGQLGAACGGQANVVSLWKDWFGPGGSVTAERCWIVAYRINVIQSMECSLLASGLFGLPLGPHVAMYGPHGKGNALDFGWPERSNHVWPSWSQGCAGMS